MLFFKKLNSEEYKETRKEVGAYFITKFGSDVHKGKGITVIFDEEEKSLKEKYNSGNFCGKENQILIA